MAKSIPNALTQKNRQRQISKYENFFFALLESNENVDLHFLPFTIRHT